LLARLQGKKSAMSGQKDKKHASAWEGVSGNQPLVLNSCIIPLNQPLHCFGYRRGPFTPSLRRASQVERSKMSKGEKENLSGLLVPPKSGSIFLRRGWEAAPHSMSRKAERARFEVGGQVTKQYLVDGYVP